MRTNETWTPVVGDSILSCHVFSPFKKSSKYSYTSGSLPFLILAHIVKNVVHQKTVHLFSLSSSLDGSSPYWTSNLSCGYKEDGRMKGNHGQTWSAYKVLEGFNLGKNHFVMLLNFKKYFVFYRMMHHNIFIADWEVPLTWIWVSVISSHSHGEHNTPKGLFQPSRPGYRTTLYFIDLLCSMDHPNIVKYVHFLSFYLYLLHS